MANYHLFIDESGDHGLKNIDPHFPVLVISATLIEEAEYVKACAKLEALKIKYFGTKEVVMHSRDIRKCDGVFSILFDLDIKQNFYKDLERFLSEAKYKIVASAIMKEKHIAAYGKLADDPYELGLTFVLERCLFETDSSSENTIQVTVESRGRKEDDQLFKRYNELLYRGSQVSSERFLKRYKTEILSKKKGDNDCGLQISDLSAYPIARHVLSPKQPYPSFNIIKPKIRANRQGIIDGYGLKRFP